MLPGQPTALCAPGTATVEYPLVAEILRYAPDPSLLVDAQQHSPPDLYTIHASLLI
jgi:hypothetical protein